jgi:probable rRNA maturation factor
VSVGSSASGTVKIIVSDEQSEVDVDTDRWADLASAVLVSEGRSGELTLTFVDRDEITALNADHMGEQRPTDVLSFPLDSLDEAAGAMPGPVLLGDVVVCPAVARDAASAHAGTVDDELALLVVHGILHVLGHDHAAPDETRVMRERERALLEQHHWHGPAPSTFMQEQES